MRNYRSYGLCGLIGGVALFALGPAQMNATPTLTHKAHSSAPHFAHAPMVRLYNPDGSAMRGPHNESTSGNWSGYALSTGSSGNYTSASFSWTVPSATYVNYGSSNPYSFNDSSEWVGIGGFSTSDLIQLGTQSTVQSNGSTTYSAWYEILPASETPLPSQYTVSAGDAMSASLTCTSNCTVQNSNTQWALSMTDSTKGWTFSINLTYQSCLCSVEWIEEAPTYGVIAALQNYGTAAMTNLLVNGGSPSLSLAADAIILQDPEGGHSAPCQAFNGNQVGNGNQFVVAYGQACPSTFDSHDFNDDAKSDIVWRNTSGTVALWLMNGGSILNSGGLGTIANTYSIIGQRDFLGTGKADMLWRDSSGNVYMWFMNGLTMTSSASLGNVSTTWTVYGTADMNGDGRGDLLWQNTSTGEVAIWFMNGSTISSTAFLGTVPSSSGWSIILATTGDILWRNTSGALALWRVNGSTVQSTALGTVPSNWQVVNVGDFNGDGNVDLLFRDSNFGTVAIWFLNSSGTVQSTATVGVVPTSSGWTIVDTGDYNGDGMSDILWTDTSGDLAIWFMNGATISSTAGLGNVGTSWLVQTLNAE